MPDNKPLHRTPSEMQTWEIIAAYRFAHQLAGFYPNAQLSHALANFMLKAQRELETRQAWRPDYVKSA
jgi:hypothetical protein